MAVDKGLMSGHHEGRRGTSFTMALDTSAKPEHPDQEPQGTDMVRLSQRLWWMPPKGTIERAREGYLYFKNGGGGFTMSDIEGKC